MRKLKGIALAGLMLVSAFATAQIIKRNDYNVGDWTVKTWAFSSSPSLYDNHRAETKGRHISGTLTRPKYDGYFLSFGVWSSSTSNSEVFFRVEGLNYIYDSSPEDKNYIETNFIFDNDTDNMYTYQGQVRSQNGFIYFKMKNMDKSFFDRLKTSNVLWVKVGQAAPDILRFSLDGSALAIKAVIVREQKTKAPKSPFSTPTTRGTNNTNNPFQR